MGLLCDYFVAPSDDDAAGTLDRLGGPGGAPAGSPDPRGWLFRRPEAPAVDTAPLFPTVAGNGIEPVVQLGTLEALLTGRTFDQVLDAGAREPVAQRDGGDRLVLRVNDALVDALVSTPDDRIEAVALPWSRTEEFWGAAHPEVLARFLHDLAALSRGARDRGDTVYCWVSV